eukprot:11186587-Lingulodinium_polyedra.AAC.1
MPCASQADDQVPAKAMFRRTSLLPHSFPARLGLHISCVGQPKKVDKRPVRALLGRAESTVETTPEATALAFGPKALDEVGLERFIQARRRRPIARGGPGNHNKP